MLTQLYILALFTKTELAKELILIILGCIITLAFTYLPKYINRKCSENRIPNVIRYNNDSFARETIKYRFRNIITNIKADKYPDIPDYSELTGSKFSIGFLDNDIFSRYSDKLLKSWAKQQNTQYDQNDVSKFFTNAPFIDVEHYFYFYILHHVNNSHGENTGKIIDPYRENKISSMEKDYFSTSGTHESKIKKLLELGLKIKNCTGDRNQEENLGKLLKMNLSANSTDLSQLFWEQFSEVRAAIDDSKEFWADYASDLGGTSRINILVDNFGIEFLSDIILGYYFILKKGRDTDIEIIYHVNELPIFVSDVKSGDEKLLFDILSKLTENNEEYTALLDDIRSFIGTKLIFRPDFFWNMPDNYNIVSKSEYKNTRELSAIKDIFNGSNLLIVKGDLNYRRMVGDRNYNPNKKIESRIGYIKCPILIIRSFKSDCTLLGRKGRDFLRNKNIEQDWQSSGKYGIIQYIDNHR